MHTIEAGGERSSWLWKLKTFKDMNYQSIGLSSMKEKTYQANDFQPFSISWHTHKRLKLLRNAISGLTIDKEHWMAFSIPPEKLQMSPRGLYGHLHLLGMLGTRHAGAADPRSGWPWRPLEAVIWVFQSFPSGTESAVEARKVFPPPQLPTVWRPQPKIPEKQ